MQMSLNDMTLREHSRRRTSPEPDRHSFQLRSPQPCGCARVEARVNQMVDYRARAMFCAEHKRAAPRSALGAEFRLGKDRAAKLEQSSQSTGSSIHRAFGA